MSPVAGSPAASQFAQLLSAGQAAAQSLRNAADGVEALVRMGDPRPAWWPECPYLKQDEDLARRIRDHAEQIETEGRRLVEKRDELFRDASSSSPFTCPPLLSRRIDCLNQLLNLASLAFLCSGAPAGPDYVLDFLLSPDHCRKVRDLLSAYRRFRQVLIPNRQLAEQADKLAPVANTGPGPFAKKFADERSAKVQSLWEHRYKKYLWDYYHDGRVLVRLLRQTLDDRLSDRRAMEENQNQRLAWMTDDIIQAHLVILNYLVRTALSLEEEAEAARAREEASVQAVWDVCRGTEQARSWVIRDREALTADDLSLVYLWSNGKDDTEYWQRAMTFRAGAELVALELYRALNGTAEDLSILQHRAPRDERWKTADIATAGHSVDVKNSRTAFCSPKTYPEHCVPKFKLDRRGRDVVISGFLSPYGSDKDEPVVWLGETTHSEIEDLRKRFESDHLRLDLSGRREQCGSGIRPTRAGAFCIPPWLFDYPLAAMPSETHPLRG